MTQFKNIRVVLVNTTHPGNIGAVARAMKTAGLHHLYLVGPKYFPHPDADARASGAEDILTHATVTSTFNEAIADCQLVIGSSARQRANPIPLLDPLACAQQVRAEASDHHIALVFGREHAGLTNDELNCCHYHVNIPSNPDFSSLNVAAAAQVICSALYAAAQTDASASLPATDYASAEQMEQFYQHLEQVLQQVDFLNPQNPGHAMAHLRRLFQRARPDQREVHILRGVLTAIQQDQG